MRLRNGRTVIFTSKERFNSFVNKNPKIWAEQKLLVFGHEKESYTVGMIFTLNSPLKPLFDRAITRLRESGAFDFLKRKW